MDLTIRRLVLLAALGTVAAVVVLSVVARTSDAQGSIVSGAPIDINGTWRFAYSSIFNGGCASVIEQDGTSVVVVAECSLIGSLRLTGMIDEATGEITLEDPSYVTLHGFVSTDGDSINGTFNALGMFTGTFTASRADDIEVADFSGDWRVFFHGRFDDACAMHIDQSLAETSARIDCPGQPVLDLTGGTNPLLGVFSIRTEGDAPFVMLRERTAPGDVLTGDWIGQGNRSWFLAQRAEEDRPVVLLDCNDFGGGPTTCYATTGEPFDAHLYAMFPPPGGYIGFHVKIGWPASALIASGTTMPACTPSSSSIQPETGVTIDCSGFSSGARTNAGVFADVQMSCDRAGAVSPDLSGTSLLDSDGQPIAAQVVTSTISCRRPQPGDPGFGDGNCDGLINSIDASLVLQIDAGLLVETGCLHGLDLNRDDRINSIDALIILQCTAALTDICR